MQYIVESRMKAAPTPEILALIPSESARGRELDAQGIRRNLFISADLSTAWQVFEVGSREAVETTLQSFPLHPYMNETITELADPARL
jgi:muconolactone delta-isomerase